MVKKIGLLFVVLFVLSCTSTKSVVRTTSTSKSTLVKKKESTASKAVVSQTPNNSTPTKKNGAEIDLVATSNVRTYEEEIKLYIANFNEIAKENMKSHGVPASVTLAQGILESGAGKGKLALSANNHFGIKCHKEWTGDSVKHDDDDAQECFRKYEHPQESYKDHSLFLTSRPDIHPCLN